MTDYKGINGKLLRKKYARSELGFPLPDALARELEGLLKIQSAEIKSLFKQKVIDCASGEEIEVDGYIRKANAGGEISQPALLDNRREESVITTDILDYEGHVVLSNGINTERFLASGAPVTLAHNYRDLHPGRCESIVPYRGKIMFRKLRIPIKGLVGKTYLFENTRHAPVWLPDDIQTLLEQKGLQGKSIGALPLAVRLATKKDLEKRPDWKEGGIIVTKSVLFEYAYCTVAMNFASHVIEKALAGGMSPEESFQLLKNLDTPQTPKNAPARDGKLIILDTEEAYKKKLFEKKKADLVDKVPALMEREVRRQFCQL